MIIYFSYDSDEMLEFLTTLNPDDALSGYFISLFIAHLIYFTVNHFFSIMPSAAETKSGISYFIHELGFSIITIIRAMTGAIPTAVILLICQEGLTGALSISIISIFIFIGGLASCATFSWLQQKTKPRPPYIENKIIGKK